MDRILELFISSVLGGFAASGMTAWVTWKIMRTSKYIETVTSERIKWIQVVRDDFNRLISSILIHWKNTDYLNNLENEKIRQDLTEQSCGPYRENTDEDLQEYSRLNHDIMNVGQAISKTLSRSEIASYALLIKLKLNPGDDIEIIKDLDNIVDFFSDYSKNMKEFDLNLKLLVEKTQTLLKREWEKVKAEVREKKSETPMRNSANDGGSGKLTRSYQHQGF
ncbi:MAG: hypothetical protein M5R41_18730 [Bacteroidia bacterium]|nr:hypothetical protein [Bacteroidia bacterium]